MVSIKVAFLVVLAFGALECHGSSLREVETRDMDIFIAAENAMKIAQNIVEAVKMGIKNSEPNSKAIIAEMTPELGKAIRQILDDARAILREVEGRVNVVLKGVQNILANIKGIKTCTDPNKPNVKKALTILENGLLEAVRAAKKKHQDDITDIEKGIDKTVKKVRDIWDTEIPIILECIKPKHKNMQVCVQTEMKKIESASLGVLTDIVMLASAAKDLFVPLATDIVVNSLKVVEEFDKVAIPTMKAISDCVAKM